MICTNAAQALSKEVGMSAGSRLSPCPAAFARRVDKEGGKSRSHDRAIALVSVASGRTDDGRVRRSYGRDHRFYGRSVRRDVQWNSGHDQKRHPSGDVLVEQRGIGIVKRSAGEDEGEHERS